MNSWGYALGLGAEKSSSDFLSFDSCSVEVASSSGAVLSLAS